MAEPAGHIDGFHQHSTETHLGDAGIANGEVQRMVAGAANKLAIKSCAGLGVGDEGRGLQLLDGASYVGSSGLCRKPFTKTDGDWIRQALRQLPQEAVTI